MRKATALFTLAVFSLACTGATMPVLAQQAPVVIDRALDSIVLSDFGSPSPEAPVGSYSLAYTCDDVSIVGDTVIDLVAKTYRFIGTINGTRFLFGLSLESANDSEDDDGEEDDDGDESNQGASAAPEILLTLEFSDEEDTAPLSLLLNAEDPTESFIQRFEDVLEELDEAGISDIAIRFGSLINSPEFVKVIAELPGQDTTTPQGWLECGLGGLAYLGGLLVTAGTCFAPEPVFSKVACVGSGTGTVAAGGITVKVCLDAWEEKDPVEPDPPTPPDGPCCTCNPGEPLCTCAPGLPPCSAI